MRAYRGRYGAWLVLLTLAAAGFYRFRLAPIPVFEYEVRTGSIVEEVLGTGTLEARVKTTISPRIQERLAAVLVDQNEPVDAGQLLARLEDGELRQQVAVAEASLAAARATAERVRVDEVRAHAVENQARQDHRRVAELVASGVSSTADLDKAVERMAVAASDLHRARAATTEAELQLVTAERSLGYHAERLEFTRIVSPYRGLVIRRDRDPGGVVVPGSSILQLISTNEIWVSAWVDETAMARLSPGQRARIVFRSEPESSYPGEVVRVGREADRETREFLVDVRVPALPRSWAIGQRAEVFIETGRKEGVRVLPLSYVTWRAGKPGVVASSAGRAEWHPVRLGLRGRESLEITEGPAAGSRICRPLDANRRLVDRQRVRVSATRESNP